VIPNGHPDDYACKTSPPSEAPPRISKKTKNLEAARIIAAEAERRKRMIHDEFGPDET